MGIRVSLLSVTSTHSSVGGAVLANARVLVVGTGKMGIATAGNAIAAGAEVFLSGRSSGRLLEAATPLNGVKTLVADPEDPQQAAQLLEQAGPLDHLAVLAGGATPSQAYGIANTAASAAKDAFARFWLSYNLLHAAVGRIRDGGSVTLLSGSSSRRPSDGRGFWGTLHGAIEALARNAAFELGPLRVNAVSPGGIGVVPMNRQLIDHSGRADDIASMVIALMANPAITATVVDVDGGEFLGRFG
ncbi:SDR family oxidoreductase [Nonomuraea sp. LPB2021202275-12-8]|uniref:SDR family oxidoreductase n=1 Tax=Nonomuraea sp. LPB2021202275-12-8 TaxID=3120159 RepID=UPI00300C5EC7